MAKKNVATTNNAVVTVSKARFTAADLKNDLYQLAQEARKKDANPRQFNAVIGAYRAILSTISMEMKAAKLGINISGN